MNDRPNKVFGIGLSRTGTTSLTKALNILDFKCMHAPQIAENIKKGNYQLPILEEYDAITDAPVVPIYPQLDQQYPDSKFILTIRDKETWLNSCERFFATQELGLTTPEQDANIHFYRFFVYQTYHFHRARFAYVYDEHLRNVKHYFQDRSEDLLIINITAGEGWEKLAPFLGKDIPSTPFPWKNSMEDRIKKIEAKLVKQK